MLIYGQLYSYYSMKTLFMVSLFVIGSVLSALAPTSTAFISGRAINRLGSAGILPWINIIIARTTSLKRRPIYSAILGSIECTNLAFGPLISVIVAHYSRWRVSFDIIIPVSVAAIMTAFLGVADIYQLQNAQIGKKDAVARIDRAGFVINLPMALYLVLSLLWA